MGAIPESILAIEAVPFVEADSDGDRTTTRVEFQAWIETQWAGLAQDKTVVSRVEFDDWVRAVFGPIEVASQFGPLSFDRNMDRRVTAEESRAELFRRFALRDGSLNDAVERGEMFVRLPRPEPMMRSQRRPPGGMPPGGPPGGGRPPGG
jgi:hypothetical protein